jgi:hypothetical protein
MAAHPIIVLWAVPRSTSTAFEWMMRERRDLTCFHEPFGEVWYQGESPLWPRFTDGDVRTPGLTYESRWAELLDAADAGPVFSKDFPHYLAHLWTEELLSRFTHSFLIRDPALTITSMYKHWPDFHEDELGFAEQRELFDRLTQETGVPPPVIDSDDLLADPPAVVEAWCASVGLDYLPGALSWEPGPRTEVSWWDAGSFHQNLRDSTGLTAQPRSHIDIGDAPRRVRDAYERVLPHYEHLRRARLAT